MLRKRYENKSIINNNIKKGKLVKFNIKGVFICYF